MSVHSKLAALMLVVLNLSGCMTAKIVGQAGHEFGEGNISNGLFYSTMGVFIGVVYDVVTLGGLLTAEQSTAAMGAAAATAAASRGSTGNAVPSAGNTGSSPATSQTVVSPIVSQPYDAPRGPNGCQDVYSGGTLFAYGTVKSRTPKTCERCEGDGWRFVETQLCGASLMREAPASALPNAPSSSRGGLR